MENQEKTCETCRHFHQHYVRWIGRSYRPIPEGHCSNPRIRDKSTDTPACQRYSHRGGKAAQEE